MSSRVALLGTRSTLTVLTLGCFLFLLSTFCSAQANQPVDEVFAGYSWLHPNGYGDLGYKVNDITSGFDLSNTYYLPQIHNLGILVDGSYHFNGSTTPINPVNNGTTGSAVGYILGGLQYKYHGEVFQPFARAFVGGAGLSPDCCSGTKWSAAEGAGGGIDLNLSKMFSIRLAQVDYIHSSYSQSFPSAYGTGWNSIRLAAGLVLNLGSYYQPPLSCSASATPAEVWSGAPVNLTTTGTNFNPKHTLAYLWTANGGKLSSTTTQATTVDTAGMAPGNYSASSTITDPRMRKNNSATCPANYVIKQPHAPEVSCSANPTTIGTNQSSSITMMASDPDGRPLTYSWSASSGQLSGSGTNVTLTPANTDAGTTITVTGTASDDRTPPMTSICTVSITIPPVQKCGVIEDWGECTFTLNPKKPWRVDNECKDTLDKLALRFQQMPNGKLDVVGYTDEKEVVTEKTMAAQRSVNVKYYLTTEGQTKLDASRIQPRDGGTKGKATHFYYVPEGCLQPGQAEEGTVVDESQSQPQPRNAPAHKKHKAKAKPAAPPAQ